MLPVACYLIISIGVPGQLCVQESFEQMKVIEGLNYQRRMPDCELTDYVKYFWALENTGRENIRVTILPDGYFDILFLSIDSGPFQASLIGLATMPATFVVPAKSRTFAISFKLPAAEYLLRIDISTFLDSRKTLTYEEWNEAHTNFRDLDAFVQSVSSIMAASFSSKTDTRKLALFNTIYETAGTVMIEQLAELIHWKSRQINRYFRGNFGLSLKKYCNILRFRASFDHLHKGQLFPVPGYFDQSHFIRDVHKFSETSPKHLANNEKDRFIQLSTLTG